MIVIDSNVMVSGLRSKLGASYVLLDTIAEGTIEYALSGTLLFEYEDAIKRNSEEARLSGAELEDFLDSIVALGSVFSPYFLWRPFLPDMKDDHVLELAVVSASDIIVTFNSKDFKGIEKFGIQTMRPIEYLKRKGILK